MKKSRLILGTILFLFFAVLLTAHPESAQAASQSEYHTIFDAAYYYETYPDVAAAFGMDENALFAHFLNYGIDEGRSGSAEFDAYAYRQRYGDLDAAFGGNMRAYYDHYLTYGRNESRIATASGVAYVGVSRKNVSKVSVSPTKTAVAESTADTKKAESTVNTKKTAVTESIAVTEKTEDTVSGAYATSYNETESRTINIKRATERIDGVTVQPGETFSFSNTVLPRTSENGYVTAPVIVSGKYVDGMGGGICQVSSTLYAAMLAAGIPATERYPHSLTMDYVPKGMDATIAGNTKDLKFKNIYTSPVVIHAIANDGVLTVKIEVI